MTKKIIIFTLSIFTALTFFNCSSGGPDLSPEPTRKVMKNIPDWFINAPTKEGYRYETATATSQDLQLAVNKATLDAASRLAATINSVMDGFTKRVQEENGLGEDSEILDRFSQVQSQTIATALKDYSVAKKQIMEEKSNNRDIFRVYVLLEWNEAAAHQRLLGKIKSDKELYEAVRASDLMEEMEKKVEAYRQRMGG